MASNSPEEAVISLSQQGGPVSESKAEEIFNALQPVKPSFLIGEWVGGSLDTGHPGHKQMQEIRFAGKNFRSVDDADPIILYDEAGQRVWDENWGHSSLREMVFRGVASAAMIYDTHPIFDHFRYVNEDMVLGAMDAPKLNMGGFFYFFLTRYKK